MNPMVRFLASTTGRMLRVLVGIALIAIGLLVLQDTAGTVVAIIGVIPLLAGVFDFCILAALLGYPLSGQKIRAR